LKKVIENSPLKELLKHLLKSVVEKSY